jgi:hypothetical protein
VVIGEPPIENPPGTVWATLVTVPLPAGVAHVPSPRQYVELDAPVPLFRFATGRFPVKFRLILPLDVTGLPVMVKSEPVWVIPTLETPPPPPPQAIPVHPVDDRDMTVVP